MNVIEVEHLQKKYRNVHAVNDISFQVQKGEIFGIVGPNGAGKTTTIESIIGLRQPDSGKIRVLGLDPQKDRYELNRKIGVQLQEAMLPPQIKVVEAIGYFASLYGLKKVDVDDLLKILEMSDKKNTYFSKLSGGQKQKLFIILVLLHNPEILFFDELTTGFDPRARRSILEYIREIKNQGKTIIFSTHLMEEAEELCDRVAFINAGQLVAIDSPANLIKQLNIASVVGFSFNKGTNIDSILSLTSVARYEIINETSVKLYGKDKNLYQQVNDHLAKTGINVFDLQQRMPSLEDVFFTLTRKEQKEGKRV